MTTNRKRSQRSLYAGNEKLNVRDPEIATIKRLETTNSFHKVAGYKITHKNQ